MPDKTNLNLNPQNAAVAQTGGGADKANAANGVTVQTPPAVPPKKTQGADWIPGFHEVVTALVGVTILVVTMTMMHGAYQTAAATYPEPKPIQASSPLSADDEKEEVRQRTVQKEEEERWRKQQDDAFNRQKDVMLYGLSLLGAVIGYYFGRMPAELHAKQAEQQAARSQNQLGEAQKDLNQAKVSEGKATGEKDVIAKEKEKIAEQKDKQRADFKQTLTSLKSNLENATTAPKVLGLSTGQPAATGLEQAKREIDALLEKL
jgi:hypothetical protein